MKKTVFIQNLFSPYRCHFFNTLNMMDKRYAIYYMGKTEKDRDWDYEKLEKHHQYWLDKYGIYFMCGRFHIHINPILILKVLFDRSVNQVILGVSYNDLNIITLAIIKRLRLTKKTFHFWAEANYLTLGARRNSALKRQLRRFVFGAVDGSFIVPGKMAVITFEKWGFPNNKYVFLPNTIDEGKLRYKDVCKNNPYPTFIMPVMLKEEIKGVLNFFRSIGEENVRKARFLIAGSGPDYEQYSQYISENKLSDHIQLLGFCHSERMNELYNMVDAFVLPSYSDASPLSLVEALYFHLPILCSSHCGNHFEAVMEGENGYVFSPLEGSDIKRSFEKFLACREHWEEMGECSYKRFQSNFDTQERVRMFISQMKSLDTGML